MKLYNTYEPLWFPFLIFAKALTIFYTWRKQQGLQNVEWY